MQPYFPPNISRINIVGTSGSGKSTFAKALAEKLSCNYVEMDAIWWKENWQNISEEEFLLRLETTLAGNNWVLDGNYSVTTPIKWANVQMVIWLDLPFHITLYRAVKRAVLRAITKQEIWHGNRESWRKLLSKDSIVWWTLTTYKRNILKYEDLMCDQQFGHIQFVRLRNLKQVHEFLASANS